MLVAYLTTDEVNLDLARRLAEACGATLYPLAFWESSLDGQLDAALYDWDFLPPSNRQEVLNGLHSGPLPCPVALHGYCLEEGQEEALHRRGIAVHRRLEPEVFQVLRQAASQPRTTGLPSDCREERQGVAQPLKAHYRSQEG
jgi:hypothetical protein